MAESKRYRLPNIEGDYVTVSITNQLGEVYRINDDGTRTLFASYGLENGNLVVVAEAESSQEFQRNLAQNSQGYNRTIGDSILDANNQTNSQPDPNQPGAAGGSTPANPNETVTEGTSEQTNFKYPEDLSLGDQDVIQFTALQYVPSKLERSATVGQQRETQDRITEGTVTLPIQAQIGDSNVVGWGNGSLDEVYRSLLNTSKNLITGEFDEKKFAESVTSEAKKLIEDSDLGLAYIAEKVIGLNKIQGRFGGVLNPNVELLFESPQLRPFEFRFRMTPRTKKESEIVRGIIKFFKKNMAVKQGTELFLRAPNTFRIKYMGKNSENQEGVEEKQSISKIKECALIGCGVNYTPQGTYMTYEDGGMVSYVIDLKFTELTPIYYEDYKDDHPIGY